MKKTIQSVIIVGAVAVALSLLVGFVSGVRLLTMLLRAGVSGVVASAAAFGLRQVAVYALPGLFDAGLPAPNSTESETAWSAADESARSGGNVDIVVDDQSETSSERYVPEMVEEVEESMAEESERYVAATNIVDVTDTIVVDEGVLDQLPDISAFSGSFVATDFVQNDAEGAEEGSGRGTSSAAGRKNSANDPETIARALQTVMRRDSR